jgi:hypothetical protein
MARYSAQASLYANPTGEEGHRVIPIRESDPPEFVCCDPGQAADTMNKIGTSLHEWAEGFRLGHDVVRDRGTEVARAITERQAQIGPTFAEVMRLAGQSDMFEWADSIPGERIQDEVVVDMAALGYPPCTEDTDPPASAVDAIVPAVVDVLNAITRRLEQLRDGGHPARPDGVTGGEQAAWRAGLNRAIALTASSALIAAGVGQTRRDGA